MPAYCSKKYSFRSGAVSHGVSAQTVGEVLEGIEARGEEITSESFLEESRPEDAPTHKIFCWDDTLAAEKWRLHESKNILNHLDVEYVMVTQEDSVTEVDVIETSEIPNVPIKSIAYVNVNPKKFGQKALFVPVERAMKDKEMRSQVLANALSELKSFRKKYSTLTELANVLQAIDMVVVEYDREEE